MNDDHYDDEDLASISIRKLDNSYPPMHRNWISKQLVFIKCHGNSYFLIPEVSSTGPERLIAFLSRLANAPNFNKNKY